MRPTISPSDFYFPADLEMFSLSNPFGENIPNVSGILKSLEPYKNMDFGKDPEISTLHKILKTSEGADVWISVKPESPAQSLICTGLEALGLLVRTEKGYVPSMAQVSTMKQIYGSKEYAAA